MTKRYIAYSTASSSCIATGATVGAARTAAAPDGDDEFLVVFDAGDRGAAISDPMREHVLMDSIRAIPIVWRGTNPLAQTLFAAAA